MPQSDQPFGPKTGLQDFDDPALARLIAGGGDPVEALDRLAYWLAATGGQAAPDPAVERQLAQDILALKGSYPAEQLHQFRGAMLARAASTLRAAEGPGRDAAVQILQRTHPFRGFFTVETVDLQHRRFDGATSPVLRREVLVAVDAVTVLPYDPIRDRVLLVEQLRAAPILRGDADPYQLEVIAGRIDAGETPEEAARRESEEEAGLTLTRLQPIAGYYPSPGPLAEFLYSYLALVDLPGNEGAAGLFGLASEGEDIRTHLWSFDRAMAALDAGEIRNAPLILSLLWLARNRTALRDAVPAPSAPATA